MRYADLHVHTFYSDSTFSPEEVARYANEKALAAVAICDHDSIDGIELCQIEGSKFALEVIPGVELTVEKADAEIHILGYFIDWKKRSFQSQMKRMQEFRVERIKKMVERLKDAGIEIDAEEVFKRAGKGSIGRLHLAKEMLRQGKVKNTREAFEKYIGFSKPCYVSKIKLSPKEAIELILKTGGVPVLAHPTLIGTDEYIPELIKEGLRGIEVYHTDHKASAVKHYEELAGRYGLLMTGGSDCHGMGKGRILLGSVRVPYDLVEKLKAESEKIRHAYR